jgi:hypothetical protein
MKHACYFLLGILVLSACSPSVVVTSSWKNGELLASPTKKAYKTVFISALTGNTNAKTIVEGALADAAVQRGFKAIKSQELFVPDFNKANAPDKETVLKKVKLSGCDAIFTVALVNKESETRYVPGTTAYNPYPMRGYYGTYWGYHSYWYGSSMYSTPGYYETDKTYFLESNLYDAETEKIVWSSQSKTVNPSDLKSFSGKYTAAIIKQLEEDGLLKK